MSDTTPKRPRVPLDPKCPACGVRLRAIRRARREGRGGGPPVRLTGAHVAQFLKFRASGMTCAKAAAKVGFAQSTLRAAAKSEKKG